MIIIAYILFIMALFLTFSLMFSPPPEIEARKSDIYFTTMLYLASFIALQFSK